MICPRIRRSDWVMYLYPGILSFTVVGWAESQATEKVVYYTYFSDENCQIFAGIKGFLAKDPFQVLQVTTDSNGDDISCVDAMACLYQPDGRTCESFGVPTITANVEIDIRDDGIYECDTSNPNLELSECSVLDSSLCYRSSISNCFFRVATSGQLTESPDQFIPTSTNLEGLDQYGFLVYYADDACTEMAGLRGFTSDNPYFLPRVGEEQDISCQLSMACYLYDSGETCEQLQLTGDPTQGVIQVEGDEVFECDSSNANVDELLCDAIDPLECKSSSVYQCHFHYRAAAKFAMDPGSTLKPERSLTTTSPTQTPTVQIREQNPTSNATGAGFQLSGNILVLLLWLSCF
jgi:hypothetical protein